MAEIAQRRPPVTAARDWLRLLPPLERWVLHGGEEARARAAPVWGVPFSSMACRAQRRGSRATLWLGPEEFLLLDASSAIEGLGAHATAAVEAVRAREAGATLPERIDAALERALAGVPHALVDLSHRQVAFEVGGAHAATILSGACPLDLDVSAFPIGMCTRTVLAKADIVLWRTDQSRFHLEVWRSFTGYVSALLDEIASEFYPPLGWT